MALIPARHDVFGECLVPESKVRLHPDAWTAFDPTEHTATEVLEYLEDAPPTEVERVIAAEGKRSRPRKTVLAEGETETPDAVGAGNTPTSTED